MKFINFVYFIFGPAFLLSLISCSDDDKNPVEKVTLPDKIIYSDKIVAEYSYDGNNRLINIINASRDESEVQSVVSISYSTSGVINQIKIENIDKDENRSTKEIAVSHPSGYVVMTYNNEEGKQVRDTIVLNMDKISVTYGFMKEMKAHNSENSYTVGYDNRGNISQITRADDTYTEYTFDEGTGILVNEKSLRWLNVYLMEYVPFWWINNVKSIENYNNENLITDKQVYTYQYNQDGYAVSFKIEDMPVAVWGASMDDVMPEYLYENEILYKEVVKK